MKHAALVARLAVYAAALVVVVTARMPEASSAITALRTPVAAPLLDPIRVMLVVVLCGGAIAEFLRRRPVWH